MSVCPAFDNRLSRDVICICYAACILVTSWDMTRSSSAAQHRALSTTQVCVYGRWVLSVQTPSNVGEHDSGDEFVVVIPAPYAAVWGLRETFRSVGSRESVASYLRSKCDGRVRESHSGSHWSAVVCEDGSLRPERLHAIAWHADGLVLDIHASGDSHQGFPSALAALNTLRPAVPACTDDRSGRLELTSGPTTFVGVADIVFAVPRSYLAFTAIGVHERSTFIEPIRDMGDPAADHSVRLVVTPPCGDLPRREKEPDQEPCRFRLAGRSVAARCGHSRGSRRMHADVELDCASSCMGQRTRLRTGMEATTTAAWVTLTQVAASMKMPRGCRVVSPTPDQEPLRPTRAPRPSPEPGACGCLAVGVRQPMHRSAAAMTAVLPWLIARARQSSSLRRARPDGEVRQRHER
jgi:hypothetical protein